ncbi:MAG: ribonuclease R [Zetaproteobacteria bacterium]|nr:ribonuclease R [Zetaproteobacteria bacterium]
MAGRHGEAVKKKRDARGTYAKGKTVDEAHGHQGSRGNERPRRSAVHAKTWIGKVSAHPNGFGFVDVEGREKGFFLPVDEMRQLLHGDVVEVRVIHQRGRESAVVERIVEHASSEIVGRLVNYGRLAMVEPRSARMKQSIVVAGKDRLDANIGDWVVVEIQRGSEPLRGKVKTVLGDVNRPSALIELVIGELSLPVEFPAPVVKQAAAIAPIVSEKDKMGRLDLTHLPFVTIDGEDAKDFDDAICVQARGDGFEAWVAIADVAHYVRAGTPLDMEAQSRSNSFYFPDRVLPMLPESLSNGLCSLNEGVDRLTMVARLRFDVGGRQRSARFYNGVICSRARLTYGKVARWLEDHEEDAVPSAELRSMLLDAARLYQMLFKRRGQRGALDLDVPETRALIENEQVVSINESPRNTAHRLIEEMMLAANTAVASYFAEQEQPLLYRVHPAPEREKIETLNAFLKPYDMFVPLGKAGSATPADVQGVLERSSHLPMAHVLQKLVLRSMQQAKYTPLNEGHFGLAYQRYCHFTSPIRRYADLVTHRSLKVLLEHGKGGASEESLRAIGEHASTQERKQQRAEWDVQAMLAALYHQKDIGEVLQARVSGLSKRRIFFELQQTLAEASVSLDLLAGAYDLDEINHCLIARRSGHIAFSLGDEVAVQIDSTDPVRGLINVSMVPKTDE